MKKWQRGNPLKASREAVEALGRITGTSPLGQAFLSEGAVQAAATVSAAMEKVSKEHEVAKRLTSVRTHGFRALRRLLTCLEDKQRGEQLQKLVLATHLRPDYGRNCGYRHGLVSGLLYVFEIFHRLPNDVAMERRVWIPCLHLAICHYLVPTDCLPSLQS